MCRHMGYLGPRRPLRDLLTEPPHSLYRQSWEPRLQRYGTVNADGFGVGWYVEGDPVPARYRRSVPIWADPFVEDLTRTTRASAVLAAVRSATEGTAAGEASAAPFAAGKWLFSHNGALPDWPARHGTLAATLPPEELLRLEARCDSALVWALVLHRLRSGASPGEALATTVTAIGAGRLNLLLTDGTTLAATAWGDTLFHQHHPGTSVTVASEPSDDKAEWEPVPDGSLVVATPERVRITPLPAPSASGGLLAALPLPAGRQGPPVTEATPVRLPVPRTTPAPPGTAPDHASERTTRL